jgi:FkbM family methyltransferase
MRRLGCDGSEMNWSGLSREAAFRADRFENSPAACDLRCKRSVNTNLVTDYQPKMEVSVKPDLIYDVGMHNGDDTAYYLEQGFRVLGIEADPELASNCGRRFANDIASGRLTVLNVGVSGENGIGKFWICEKYSEWNSFRRSVASRDGCCHHSIEIPTQRFEDILRRFGIPVYLKIDIEGNDWLCLEALRRTPLPKFISAEDQGSDREDGLPSVLLLMHEIGYQYFKLVSQRDFAPIFRWNPELLDRGLKSAAYGRLRIPILSRVAEYMTFKNILARRNGGYRFPAGSSGPWGDGIPGSWVTFEKACRLYNSARTKHFSSAGVTDYSFWCDWHAKIR